MRAFALVLVAALAATVVPGIPVVHADEDRDYLDACLAAAGGETGAARRTCFGQVSEVCLASSGGSTEDMVDCAARELTAWDSLMEDALADLAESEPEERVQSIRAAQEVWQEWRDARCAVYGTYNGSIYRPLAGLCRAETTSRRVADLWAIESGLGDAP